MAAPRDPEPMTRTHTAFITGLFFALGFVFASGQIVCGWVQVAVLLTTCVWMPLRGALGRLALFLLAMVGGLALWHGLSPGDGLQSPWLDPDARFWVLDPLVDQLRFAVLAGLAVLAIRWGLAGVRDRASSPSASDERRVSRSSP